MTAQVVRSNMVVLDIGFKSEGTDLLEEFGRSAGAQGGVMKSKCCRAPRIREGSVVLSMKKADLPWGGVGAHSGGLRDRPASRRARWSRRSRAALSSTSCGVDAFLPGSQIALRRVPNIDELLGQKYEFKIIKLNKRRRNGIVVSRRVILDAERAGKREKR